MRSIFLLSTAVLLCGSLASGAVYYADASKGDDAAAGTEAAPWKTISRGVKDLKPGDVLRIAAGTYRETVNVACRGTAEAPITIQGTGGRVLVTGADEIKRWKVCTKDDAAGHPDFAKIYWADVDFLPTVLLDGRRERPSSRFPKEGFATSTATTADTLTDTANLTQTRDVWASSEVRLRFADGREERWAVESFDPKTHALKLKRPARSAEKPEAGAVQYCIEGALPGLAAGQWACEKKGEGRYRVYYWPAGGDISKAAVETPRRSHGLVLSRAAWVTVDGLEVAWGGGQGRADEAGISALGDAGDPGSCAGLVVKNCISHDHGRFGVFLQGCKKPVLRNSLVYNCGPVAVLLAGNVGALVEECEIGPNRVDGFRDTFNGTGTVVRKCYIHHHFDSTAHPDNIQLHNDVKNITFEDNLLICGGQSVMMSRVDGFTFRGNVVAGSAANMLICAGVDNVVIERNTLCLGTMSVLAPSGKRYRLSGNIWVHNGGAQFYAFPEGMAAESDRNLFWIVPGRTGARPWREGSGAFASLTELHKEGTLERNSEFKDPQFKNAPVYVALVQHWKPADKSTPGRLCVDNVGLFAAGDHVETNFDGVVRTVKAVEGGAVVIDPPMERLTAFLFVINWKDKTNYAYDFSSPLNDKYGSTVNVPAYQRGDFNGDGKRDVPESPKD